MHKKHKNFPHQRVESELCQICLLNYKNNKISYESMLQFEYIFSTIDYEIKSCSEHIAMLEDMAIEDLDEFQELLWV